MASSPFKDLITCKICNELLQHPKLLSCCHTFCQNCLQIQFHEQKHVDDLSHKVLKCPTCKTSCPIPASDKKLHSLTDNTLVTTLLSAMFNNSWQQSLGVSDVKDTALGCTTSTRDAKFCKDCDKVIYSDTDKCKTVHNVIDAEDESAERLSYLKESTNRLAEHQVNYEMLLHQYTNTRVQLMSNKRYIEKQIIKRADEMCAIIENHKNHLLAQIRGVYDKNLQNYAETEKHVTHELQQIRSVKRISETLQSDAQVHNVLGLSDDISARVHQLLSHPPPDYAPITCFKLTNPTHTALSHTQRHTSSTSLNVSGVNEDVAKQLRHCFGEVVQGSIHCGKVQKVTSFNIDLTWPTGMAVIHGDKPGTHIEDGYVITGKTGAIEGEGRVLFYRNLSSSPRVYTSYTNGVSPTDVTVVKDDARCSQCVIVADTSGTVTRFTTKGDVIDQKLAMFKGTGRLASDKCNKVYVTSAAEKLVYICNSQLNILSIIRNTVDIVFSPNYISVSNDGAIVISDVENNCLVSFVDNNVAFRYQGYTSNTTHESQYTNKSSFTESNCDNNNDDLDSIDNAHLSLRCPSAVCCDRFGNILMADFTNDRVHLVSNTGQFLGYLLLKEDGVSCPNFITLNPDGQLIVGQYGGDINVYQYLCYFKHI